jgi:site-specific DNA recombinase
MGASIDRLPPERYHPAVIHQRSRPKEAKHEFPFKGIVRCGHCGSFMTGSINKGHRYYKCSNSRQKCNGNGYIREDKLAGSFSKGLNKIRLSDTDCQLMLSAIRDFKKNEVDERTHEIERLSKETSKLQGKIDKAYDDYQDKRIDQDTWQRANQRYSSSLSEAKARIQLREKPGSSLYDHAERLINTAMSASGQFSHGNPAKQRSILKAIVSNCSMTSGNLHYSYKKPFDIIAEGSNSPDWWS